MARFLGVLGLLIGAFYAFFAPFTQSAAFESYLGLIADVSGSILNVLGQDVTVSGAFVTSNRFSVEIVMGCDGLEMTALFVAASLALPVALRTKLTCVVVGTVILTAVNLVRIVTLFCIGVYFPKALDVLHFDAWPGLLMVLILSCWLLWARWAVQRGVVCADASI